MRDLNKCDRKELLSLADRRGKRIEALEEELSMARARAVSADATADACLKLARGPGLTVVIGCSVGALAGLAALAWCCYLVGSGVLVWPWEVGGGA